MPHMFRIDFVTNHANGLIESGKVIVTADSHELAQDIICQQLNLPPSRTRFESQKIKPPCYQIESQQTYPDKKTTKRTARDLPGPPGRFQVTVVASNVNAQNEQHALRKVGEELCARGTQTRLRHNLQLAIDCSTTAVPSRPMSPLEELEMFQPKGRVQGGRVR